MRLFLSSQDLGHHADLAFDMCGPGKRVAFIANAADDLTPVERAEKSTKKKLLFEEAGFSFEEIDLRDYFGKPEELEVKLGDFDLAWCNGGNTFILRRAMRASGFDEILLKRLKGDSIMYGGSSAGSCVAAPSLHGIEHGDRPSPEAVPMEYPAKDIIWEGLNLVSFMIVPHCDQEWFSEQAEATVRALYKQNVPMKTLNDGEVVVVNGDVTRVLQPIHDDSRYRPIAQKPYCCVPTCLQMVLHKNNLPKMSQEEIGIELGLVVPSEFADEFINVPVSEEPVVGSGFGTRIQDPNYSLRALIKKQNWPFTLNKKLASNIPNERTLRQILEDVEQQDGDALLCYQNDRGFGHVVVFDRIVDDLILYMDPSPLHDKWRSMDLSKMYERIKSHGDDNMGGTWLLEKSS